jgi:hypothetical protein
MENELKYCRKCDATKGLDDFHRDSSSKDGRCVWCKECKKAVSREWSRNNPDKVREHGRKRVESGAHRTYQLKKKYQLTDAQYWDMLADQGGCCAICETEEPGRGNKYFVVDHDHGTGKVRGLLCNNCNRVLGLFGDSIETIESAIAYLDHYSK